ncbi:hypothetical protein [Actinopolymorpha sp. B9G3]|uniref:hypothetical protein n=1 Tax=Actinopolymorpha sp. B9G3 TaxID=3158970 RepID=UPI0032D8E917
MSPKSRGRRRDQRRPTDRRRAQRRTAASSERVDQTAAFVSQVLQAAAQLTTLTSPLEAEAFASSVAGAWWQQSGNAAYGPTLVARAQQAATPEAAALLHGLAAVTEPGLDAAARAALDDLAKHDLPAPAWATTVGRAQVRECFTVDDELGDASQVILSYSYADEPAHAVVVLVDHNLGGIAKDIWVTDAVPLVERVRATAAEDPGVLLADADPAALRPLLADAMAATDQAVEPPVSDNFPQLRALLLARVRALPDGGTRPDVPAWSEQDQHDLVAEFVSSPEAAALAEEADARSDALEAIALELVAYGSEHDRGRPLRVSPTKLEVFLLGWLPMTGLLDRGFASHMPAVLPAWVRFAARRTSLSAEPLAETLTAAETFAPQFVEAYDDPDRWGPARVAVESMLADIDPERDDADEVFARRMFALPEIPGPDFDADDESSFLTVTEREHPEHAAVLSDPSADPVVDGVNVRLQAATHAAVARQLWFDDPPEVWTTAQRLLDAGYDRHDILHALMYVLTTQIQQTVAAGAPADPDAYRAALDALPESWEKTFAHKTGD